MKKIFLHWFLILVGFQMIAQDHIGYKVGDKVHDFSLLNINGQKVALADYKDAKGAIVIFTCNHCPFAKMYEDRIINLHNQFASKGFPIVAINPNDSIKQPDDSFAQMVIRAKEKNYPFAYLLDETQTIARQFGAMRTPHVYILQKKQKIWEVVYIGAIDNKPDDAKEATEKYVEDALNQLLVGQQVALTTTKAIGCTIKWK